MQRRFTSPDEFKGGPDELFDFADDASDNPTFYADLENPQSLNKYQYAFNNPLLYVDPDGHDPIPNPDPCCDQSQNTAQPAVVVPLVAAAAAMVAIVVSAIDVNAPRHGDPVYRSDDGAQRLLTNVAVAAGSGAVISKAASAITKELAEQAAH